MHFSIRFIQKLIMSTLITCTIVVIGVIYYMEYALPDTQALKTVQLQVPLRIYTHDHKLIASFGEKRRIPLAYDQIPKTLIEAVLATEDQRYFKHGGVDMPGLGRAAIQLLLTGRKLQGGSTITMQVARSFYLSRHKTFGRKLREILLAIKIEHQLSKEKILELYLNKVFFGNRAYGVEAAAQIYYGKHLNELSLDQYAMLAGIPKAPSQLNPLVNAAAAIKRRNHVLMRMLDQGYINEKSYHQAIATPLGASYHDLQTEVTAPDAAELARTELEQRYGDIIYTDGFKAFTTLDSRDQTAAVKAVHDNLLAYDKRHGYRGPIANLGKPSLKNMEEWEESLRHIPTINGLEPAAIIEMAPRTLTALRQNGELAMIPWSTIAWARKQVNPNYLGPKPTTTNHIVSLGDVIYIEPTENGYGLSQSPKAEASLIALNPTNGAILAMVGGFDYRTSKFNRIVRAERQPGSSFKPFIYSAALQKGLTLATVINDAPLVIENPIDHSLWRPQNDTHKFYGPTRLRTALIKSRNLVSIRVLAEIGLPYTLDYLNRFGFEQAQLPAGLSLALGTAVVTPIQLASAYATFANGGMHITPFILESVHDAENKVIYAAKPAVACEDHCENNPTLAPRVITAQNAFLVTSALHDVIEHGTAKFAKSLGRKDLAGKTGTTQNQVDAWFAGYQPNIVAVAWFGFDQPRSLHEWGAQTALPMWVQFMGTALKELPDEPLATPPDIVNLKIDPETGLLASNTATDAISEYFMLPFVPSAETSDPLPSPENEDYQAAAAVEDLTAPPNEQQSDTPEPDLPLPPPD